MYNTYVYVYLYIYIYIYTYSHAQLRGVSRPCRSLSRPFSLAPASVAVASWRNYDCFIL